MAATVHSIYLHYSLQQLGHACCFKIIQNGNSSYKSVILTSPHSLQWRHDGHDVVSNHQPHHCLLNRLFRRRSKKTSKFRATGLCEVTGEFPHKGPVTRKMFPFDDVIMCLKQTGLHEEASRARVVSDVKYSISPLISRKVLPIIFCWFYGVRFEMWHIWRKK